MTIKAVIFDWGGTLTPWHDVNLVAQWYAYAEVYDPAHAAAVAQDLADAEHARWRQSFDTAGSAGTGVLNDIFVTLGIDTSSALHLRALANYLDFWQPHTYADPHARKVLQVLRERGLLTAVLSNTMWPRTFHEEVFARDSLLDLLDVRVYSSELPASKPHRDAFHAVLDECAARGRTIEPAECVFVGDRLVDDIRGAQLAGFKAVWIPHSALEDNDHARDHVVPDATIQHLPDLLEVINEWS